MHATFRLLALFSYEVLETVETDLSELRTGRRIVTLPSSNVKIIITPGSIHIPARPITCYPALWSFLHKQNTRFLVKKGNLFQCKTIFINFNGFQNEWHSFTSVKQCFRASFESLPYWLTGENSHFPCWIHWPWQAIYPLILSITVSP